MRVGIASLLVLCTCLEPSRAPQRVCAADADCDAGLICFPDGCGDPGENLFVEVTGNTSSLHAQDFDVSALGGIAAVMDLDVRGPLTLSGALQRNDPDLGVIGYADGVTITASGQSELIPGQHRRYSLVLPVGSPPAYQMYVGAGSYTVTARPTDTSIPYQLQKVTAGPGQLTGASFVFPSVDSRLILTGRLVKSTKPLITYLSGMTIQAFETVGGTPLSQPAVVSSMGDFQLYVDQSAVLLSSITLVALPRDNTALVPTKAFVLSPVPIAQVSIGTLEMGDFGDALPQVTGTLVGSDSMPIAGAAVSFEGKVNGEGTFKSTTVTTDANGVFSIDLLPSASDSPYTMTAIPPPGSRSGILQTLVRAGVVDGKPALTVGTMAKLTYTCPDRVTVTGKVISPTGAPAVAVEITATPIEALDQRPMPTRAATTSSDSEGKFRLVLDPARYRLDYVPAEATIPRKSRVVRVEPEIDVDAGELLKTADLGPFQFAVGRTINGLVTVRPNTLDLVGPDGGKPELDGGIDAGDAGAPEPIGVPVANALVRFYRVTTVEGVPSSLLVGEAICDDQGHYQLALPDHPAKAP